MQYGKVLELTEIHLFFTYYFTRYFRQTEQKGKTLIITRIDTQHVACSENHIKKRNYILTKYRDHEFLQK